MNKRLLKQTMFMSMVLAFSFAISIGFYFGLSKNVTIVVDGEVITVKTVCSTLGEVLKRNNINYSENDYISMLPDAKLMPTNEVIIKRAVPVFLEVDRQKRTILTYKDTVAEVLEQEGIVIGEKDKLEGHGLSDTIEKDMSIKVIRTKEFTETITEEIPFEFVEKENWQLNKGIKRVVQPGKNGIRQNIFKIVMENGVEISRQLINSTVISSPINEVIEYGTVSTYKTSRGEVVSYRKVLDMRATAYTSSFKDTGKHPGHPQFGITYTGIKAERGIIAVDPKVIPLGTKVYVECMGDVPDYGYALAADIGSAIKGDLIDLYLDDQETVDAWGCKKVRVYILSE